MNENRQYDNFTHTQFTINSDSYSFDSPSDMRKMKKITSTSSSLSNKNICDVRGCRQDDDVPQAKGVKTKTGIRKETDKRAVSGTKTKAKSKAGVTRVCTCHPIAWSLITSSCLSRGKIWSVLSNDWSIQPLYPLMYLYSYYLLLSDLTSMFSHILFNLILFYIILSYSISFYIILSYSILFYLILYYSILFYLILYYSILFYLILSYSILPYFILSNLRSSWSWCASLIV